MRLILEINTYTYVMLSKDTNIGEMVKALSGASVCDKNYIEGKYVYTPKEDDMIQAILIQDISESMETSNA